MKALTTTTTNVRPGKLVSASVAPSGNAISAASTTAERLTYKERPTIAYSVGSPPSTSCSADALSVMGIPAWLHFAAPFFTRHENARRHRQRSANIGSGYEIFGVSADCALETPKRRPRLAGGATSGRDERAISAYCTISPTTVRFGGSTIRRRFSGFPSLS